VVDIKTIVGSDVSAAQPRIRRGPQLLPLFVPGSAGTISPAFTGRSNGSVFSKH
jgi:hypothetical protein